jgi:hypothetical protein
MKFDKQSFGKRFSKVLTKMFWHLNHAIPNYSSVYPPTSVDKHVSNSHRQQEPITNQIGYTKHHRQRPIRRITTLTSIKEENEIELMNCK